MLDKKFLSQSKETYEASCAKRHIEPEYDKFAALYKEFHDLNITQENLRAQQHKIHGASPESKKLKEEFLNTTHQKQDAEKKLHDWLIHQPNLLLDTVPIGATEHDNLVIYESEHKKISSKKPHYDLIDNLTMKEESANMSGSRFLILKKTLSKLKRALTDFMINSNEAEGYEEYTIPYIVNEECLVGTGQLPKFANEAFHTNHNKWLISTGEIGLVNMFQNHLFTDLPKLCMTFSPCFRAEAGAAGRDTKGIIRLHQFHKVELVTLCTPETAEEMHEKKLQAACKILKALNLPYRIILLCGGDTGFTATKQYDIEVWMPGLNRYLEIASCSQCGTFQAMRANIRYKLPSGKTSYVHTLNGSSLPIERLIAAIIENYINDDNSITIPHAIQNVMGGSKILADGSIE